MRMFKWVSLGLICCAGSGWTVEAELFQVSWSDNQGGYVQQYSDWGVLALRYSTSDLFSMYFEDGQYRGFVNVVIAETGGSTGGSWVVRNLPVAFPGDADPADDLAENIPIPLGNMPGAPVAGRWALVTLTPNYQETHPVGARDLYGVTNTDWLFGGMVARFGGLSTFGNTGNMRWPMQGARKVPPPMPFNLNLRQQLPTYELGEVVTLKIKEKDVVGVDEELCGCSAGAMARSLRYMADAGTINLNDTTADIYKDAKTHMKTKIGNNGGTPWANIPAGMTAYVKNKTLPLAVTATVNASDAMAALGNGSDVSFHFQVFGLVPISHSAFVSSMQALYVKVNNVKVPIAWKMTVVDDRKQGDGKAAADKHTMYVDPAGNVFLLNEQNMPEVTGRFGTAGFLIKTKK